MGAIIDFIKSIGEAIIALVEFVIKMIGDLIYVVGLLGELLPVLPNFLTWLPAAVGSLLMVVFGVLVVLRVLGRSE